MSISCKKGDWVEIHRVIFPAKERTAALPADTLIVPYEMWLKGYALEEGQIGNSCTITTITGRSLEGILTEINPGFSHSFGPAVAELQQIGPELREDLRGIKR